MDTLSRKPYLDKKLKEYGVKKLCCPFCGNIGLADTISESKEVPIECDLDGPFYERIPVELDSIDYHCMGCGREYRLEIFKEDCKEYLDWE